MASRGERCRDDDVGGKRYRIMAAETRQGKVLRWDEKRWWQRKGSKLLTKEKDVVKVFVARRVVAVFTCANDTAQGRWHIG